MLGTRSVALLVGASLTTLVSAADPASAEETVCRGTLGAVVVDNLLVPQLATCRLSGTRVKGTAKVARDAILATPGARTASTPSSRASSARW